MEKYSAFRDPGTGIQPFLTPLPPSDSNIVLNITLPLRYLLGVLRTGIVVILASLYTVLVEGICSILLPIPPLYRAVTYVLTAILCRFALFILGFLWIPVETVTRKRGRVGKTEESWTPRAGDLIVSNWVSWIEILWLAFRFNPVFVLPVSSQITPLPASRESTPVMKTPGRRTGTGSAAIHSTSTRSANTPIPITGFRRVSLLSIICATGQVPLLDSAAKASSLEELRKTVDRPIVVFPECTTSNGRGLLRFAEIFTDRHVPIKGYKVFVMCIRYDPPTAFSPTPSHSIPTSSNPLPHLFELATALKPLTASVRLLSMSESPSSPSFLVNEVTSGDFGRDPLSSACGALIAQLGKLKRVGMGWEDKAAFLSFYHEKRK
ncbi:hypothetical protein HETIRDRAFT_171061 [Heterobasidion irregulare TC 32-1]|uniref:Phospholipid/glycerol acyltransferase domain-containing protein n=1 Tax=Heterobasidion irregulare (strain TC 32-1) TaxID=747525 RepID=W4KFC4_HETIT|nr:uncharacterized protein HETIRDRAFT_171061 [Heterobasidion irregulare TC 32-1]ETW84557.1 hypothetical protein HETIRDRAFT_171061 [Heterobasidion irregulare TC 32-1]